MLGITRVNMWYDRLGDNARIVIFFCLYLPALGGIFWGADNRSMPLLLGCMGWILLFTVLRFTYLLRK